MLEVILNYYRFNKYTSIYIPLFIKTFLGKLQCNWGIKIRHFREFFRFVVLYTTFPLPD